MAIPKSIHQTFKTSKLPLITKWHIRQLKKKNPDYTYHFYDDNDIDAFIKAEFDQEVLNLYRKIKIGAAKADFFRYAILYKKGGIYLDIDSRIISPLSKFIISNDHAVISKESNLRNYIQYALFFEKEHPFLKKTLEVVMENLKENKYPGDVHKTTGPAAFTKAIEECLKENISVPYREMGIDYEGHVEFSYPMSKTFLYGFSRKGHWKKQMKEDKSILKEQ